MAQHHLTRLLNDSAWPYTTQYHLPRLSSILHHSASSHATQHHLTRLGIISSDSASSDPTTQHHLTWLSSILQVSTVVAAFVKQHRYFKWQTAEILCDLRQKSLSTNTRLKTNKQNNRLLIVSMARPCHKIWSKDVARAEVFTIIMTIFYFLFLNPIKKKINKKNQQLQVDCFKNSPLSWSRFCKWEIRM